MGILSLTGFVVIIVFSCQAGSNYGQRDIQDTLWPSPAGDGVIRLYLTRKVVRWVSRIIMLLKEFSGKCPRLICGSREIRIFSHERWMQFIINDMIYIV